MKPKHLFIGILTALSVFPLIGAFAQDGPNSITIQLVTTFDYPGASSTISEGINDRGDITGLFVDASGATRGFVRFHSGAFSAPIIEPNDGGNLSEGRGINHARTVAGFYAKSDGTFHGYFLNGGAFTEFDVPGAFNTYVEGLNNAGDFVGANDSTGVLQAFKNIGGTTSTISIPDATGGSYAFGINRSRESTGQYTDSSGGIHGWWQDSALAIHAPFDPPGALQTLPFGINNQTFVVGRFTDGATGIERGFLFNTRKDSYVIFDGPNAVFTSLNGINATGSICGRYDDGSGILHGILARIVTGPVNDAPAPHASAAQRADAASRTNNQE